MKEKLIALWNKYKAYIIVGALCAVVFGSGGFVTGCSLGCKF